MALLIVVVILHAACTTESCTTNGSLSLYIYADDLGQLGRNDIQLSQGKS